jgi:quinoprotein glucose dehydrogenase
MGSTNSWSGFSLDEKRGIVFAGTGSPTNDMYGGDRLGDGLYGNCVLAIDAATGKLLWHFQTVHHDVWDMDLSSPPVCTTVVRDGKEVDAVAQTTKTGFVFLFERETGKPLFPIEERPVPTNSPIPGEKLSPTQPFPAIPAPFARQKLTVNDLNTLVSDSAEIRKRFLSLRSEGVFTPPTKEGTVILPGYDGGGEWGGPAVDPATHILYVNSNEMAWILNIVENKPESLPFNTNLEAGKSLYKLNCMACHGPERLGSGDYPSLIGVGKKYTQVKFDELLSTGRRMMPGFNHLTHQEKNAIASFILDLKAEQPKKYSGKIPKQTGSAKSGFSFTGYNKFLTKEGYPAISPPWGTLNAIDLNTGKYLWKIPLGEYEELKQKGIPATGRENYGGPVVTAGGLLFIAATSDRKFRAINKRTGRILFETDLPASGIATPSVYEVRGKQYVVIACGGSKWGGKQGDAYVAFTLKEK